WVVYGKAHIVIILPILLWMVDTSFPTVLLWIESTNHTQNTILGEKFGPFLTTFAGLTIVQNIMTTGITQQYSLSQNDTDSREIGLIIWPIWKVDRESARYRNVTTRSPTRLQKPCVSSSSRDSSKRLLRSFHSAPMLSTATPSMLPQIWKFPLLESLSMSLSLGLSRLE
ncbi:hypothetical protein C8J56DRAFT_770005, partial [Mycena floridula]